MTKKRLVRDLGELGQDHFKAWCTNNGLSAVAAKPDKLGWDYFVEFEPEVDSRIPLDRQNDLKKILVQVKSTDKSSRSVQGKLSAIKKLVDTDLPAFIAHLEYDGGVQPLRVRLLHIGPAQIEQVLRKVRQTEAEGRALHKATISLALADADDIAPDGGNLHTLFRNAVPSTMAAYVFAKEKSKKSVGYDQNSVSASILFGEGFSTESLVDLMLGKIPTLPVEEFTVRTNRFKIPLEKDIERIGSGLLSVEVTPLRKAQVAVISQNQSQLCEIEVNLFVPGIPGLSKRNQKVRLANDFLDMTLHFGESSGSFNFFIDPAKRLPIVELAEALKFGVALGQEDSALEISLGFGNTLNVPIPFEAKQYQSLRQVQEFVELLSIACFRHRKNSEVETSLTEMVGAFEKNQEMVAVLTKPGVRLTYEIDKNFSAREALKGGLLYMPVCVEFGSVVYVAIVKADAEVMIDEECGRLAVLGGNPQAIEGAILERSSLNLANWNERAKALGYAARKDRVVVTTTLFDDDCDGK